MTAKGSGVAFANDFATTHEQRPDNTAKQEAMDLHNDQFGRLFTVQGAGERMDLLPDMVESFVDQGHALVIAPDYRLVPSDQVPRGYQYDPATEPRSDIRGDWEWDELLVFHMSDMSSDEVDEIVGEDVAPLWTTGGGLFVHRLEGEVVRYEMVEWGGICSGSQPRRPTCRRSTRAGSTTTRTSPSVADGQGGPRVHSSRRRPAVCAR